MSPDASEWACAICGEVFPIRPMARACERRHEEMK